ncbi:MAG: hypothetical protein ACLFPV_09300 [Spirochaetaceae bacterium]
MTLLRLRMALVTTVIALVVTACTTVTTEVRTGPEENWRYTITEPKRDTSPKGPLGKLEYRGRDIRPYFSRIVIGDRTFDYAIRIDRADFQGYRMATDQGQPEDDASLLNDEDRERGWYFASLTGRRSGTPGDWVWVKRLNVEAFVDPSHMSRLADSLDLYPIDGNTEDEPRSGVSLGIRFTTVF